MRRAANPTSGPGEAIPGYPFSYAVTVCAPWDGPAVSVYLTPELSDSTASSYPQLRVSVYRSESALLGNTFSWPAKDQVGVGVRCVDSATCEAATTGRITFLRPAADSSLDGTTELTFPDGTTIRGAFRATWRPTRVMCG